MMNLPQNHNMQPTPAYIGASWAVMLIGVLAFGFGLLNATMQLNEKGYYFAVLCLGLYAAISLQKTIRDRAEDIPTTQLYYMISWLALFASVALIVIGLFNAQLTLSEKGFYMMAFTMSLFGAITIQKNIRDVANAKSAMTGGVAQIGHANNATVTSATDADKASILHSPFRRNKTDS